MIKSMKRSTISAMIKSMVNPDSGDSAITRYFAQLDSVQNSHFVYANTLEFDAGDTYEFEFLAPTGVVGTTEYLTDRKDGETLSRAWTRLTTGGNYDFAAGFSVEVDGLTVSSGDQYPVDGKLHLMKLSFSSQLSIEVLGKRNAATNFYNGIIANAKATMSGVTTTNPIGLATTGIEASTEGNNALEYVFINDAAIEQYTHVDGNWLGGELWTQSPYVFDGTETNGQTVETIGAALSVGSSYLSAISVDGANVGATTGSGGSTRALVGNQSVFADGNPSTTKKVVVASITSIRWQVNGVPPFDGTIGLSVKRLIEVAQ